MASVTRRARQTYISRDMCNEQEGQLLSCLTRSFHVLFFITWGCGWGHRLASQNPCFCKLY